MSSTNSLQTILLKSDVFEVSTANAFRKLREDTLFTDVTLVSNDNKSIKAHKVILCSASPYLRTILESKASVGNPVLSLNIEHVHLESIVEYIYMGQVRVGLLDMHHFLEAGRLLQIHGLSKMENEEIKVDSIELKQSEKSLVKIDFDETIRDIQSNKEEMLDLLGTEIERLPRKKLNTNEMKYGCDQCTFKAKFKRYLISHRGKEHPKLKVQCEECGYMGTEAGLKQHKIKHKGEIIPCDQCDYRTQIRYRLNEHIKNSHEIEYHFCDKCIFKTKRKSNLRKHVETEHDGILSKCEICELNFKIPSRLEDHKRALHEGTLYNCDSCDYSAIYRGIMNRHVKRVHKKVRYPCNSCHYQATESGNLKAHIQSVHHNVKRK